MSSEQFENPKVGIIVLNWNGKNDTLTCLRSLSDLSYKNYAVLVIDNGSEDDSVLAIRAAFPNISVVENGKNLGFAAGMNVGISAAIKLNCNYIFPLNNDTKVESNTLSILVAVLESDKQIGAVTPRVNQLDNPERLDNAGLTIDFGPQLCTHRGYNQVDEGQFSDHEQVDSFCGSGFVIRASLIEKIGMFDEEYFAYGEDLDLAVRVRREGYKIIYVPNAQTWHKLSATADAQTGGFKAQLVGRNSLLFMKKNANLWQWIVYCGKLAWTLPQVILKYTRQGDFKMLWYKCKGAFSLLFEKKK